MKHLQELLSIRESLAEGKGEKVYKITKTRDRDGREYVQTGTLADLIKAYSYTLETGKSYEHEKGNKKINTSPKTLDQLIRNLQAAVNNAAANGYAGVSFDGEEVKSTNESLSEGKDLDELIDAWMEKNNAWSTEGQRGVNNIEKLIRALGYHNMDDFLEDNPGAIESLFEWIREQNISEWKEALAEFEDNE